MRRQENDPLDRFIKEQFEAYKPEAPEMVWKSIERELDRESVFRRRMAVARWAVAASVLICIFFAAFYFSNDTKKELAKSEKPVTSKSAKAVKENTPVQIPEGNDLQAAVKVEKEQPEKTIKKIMAKTEMPVLVKEEKQKNTMPVETETVAPILPQEPVVIAQETHAEEQIPAAKKPLEIISGKLHPSQGSKTVVNGVTGVVNYLAKKVKKDDEELIKINKRSIDTNTNVMSYNIDLGFLKISRVKHQSN